MNAKRFFGVICMSVFLALTLSLAVAMAGDIVVNAPIEKATVKMDKNGAEYVQFIITETRTLGGVTYPAGVPTLAFQDMVEKAKTLKSGDNLHAVCAEREYQGRKSLTIRAFVE